VLEEDTELLGTEFGVVVVVVMKGVRLGGDGECSGKEWLW